MTTTATEKTPNPNWWRTAFASLILAILLKFGLHIPLLTSLVALGIIFTATIVKNEMSTGLGVVWKGWNSIWSIAVGMVVFLALRLIVGKALNLYPVDTLEVMTNRSGGLVGEFLLGRNFSNVILFEILFALVAGWMIAKRKNWVIGPTLGLSLLVLATQFAASDPKVKKSFDDRGVVGSAAKEGWEYAFGKIKPTPPPSTNSVAKATPTVVRPWEHRTLDIPPEGLLVYLYQGWKDWPKGGPITITTPSGKTLRDAPGVINHFGFQVDGIYTFRADPVGSDRKVEILNQW